MATCAYIEFDFNIHMEKLKMKSKLAYDYVANIKKEIWVRHIFNPRSKVDLVVNNLHESFNFYILEARDKLKLTMTKWIRTVLI